MSRIGFDEDTIRVLAAVLRESGLTEIELQDGERRVRLARAAPAPIPAQAAIHPPQPASPIPAAAPALATGPALPADEQPPPAGAVPSPMVGIAYLSADPGSTPFVTVGQPVTAGQTVLLIEAMKTFNQIKAPRAGVVTQILVTGGQPVEYGQPLLVIA